MNSTLVTVVLAAVAMAALAMFMRRASGGDDATGEPGAPESSPEREREAAGDDGPSHAEVLEDDDEGLGVDMAPEAVLYVTSEGEVFLPDRTGARVLQLGERHRAVTSGQTSWEDLHREMLARRAEGAGLPGIGLDVGDFTAGRVTRGAPDADPWRLELLGRDGEYQPFAFETEEAARGVLALLEGRAVVKRPLDDDGTPIPVPAEEFAEARRRFEDTLEELANMPDVEEPGGPRP